jgi:hypothetical protein
MYASGQARRAAAASGDAKTMSPIALRRTTKMRLAVAPDTLTA